MPSGFVDRYKGKLWQPSGCLQQIGSGPAVSGGGGLINSTASCSTAGGTQLSTAGTTTSTLVSQTLPPRTLDRLGRQLLIYAWGTFSTFNAGAKTVALSFGAVSVSLQNSTTVTALQPWAIMMNVAQNQVGSTTGGQSIFTQTMLSSVHGGVSVSTGAENVLALSTIKVTGISSSPTSGSPGDVTVLGLSIEALN